ncbi:N-acetylmuramic acid 6-phosphate etherase [Haloechinothrix sp. YIM 98757]|uniref:N-acetylmuramic acid 6-phosphate etherase n=1 Tax=Haloechinothrix aidingensis TaxID=2752311 RepID=A0A838A6W3_9PSEU|nr:N-acetylmuramic acid 6-phosphate etherase [Haloechinothrix aidingensis]MBA0124888.1 N-acetylmuramic acid 6-phosphate etherase [Haloechinothrix aidingensis]
MNEFADDLGRLETERPRRDLADLDTRDTAALVAQIFADDGTVAAAVAAEHGAITAAVEAVTERLRAGGRLCYVGAGTPGRLAVMDAAECVPTFGSDPGQVLAVLAGGTGASTATAEGAEDDAAAGAVDLRAAGVSAADAVVGVTASGRTPYVLGAVEAARAAGATTIGMANNPDSRVGTLADIAIEVRTGAEVLAGSTRMKAGTAQKLVLNTLSTATMIKLGKTYGNLMVDLRATNEKLRDRARRIVIEATGVDSATAEDTLLRSAGHAKTAIVALLAGTDPESAARRLDACAGHVRRALHSAAGWAGQEAPRDRGQ